MSITINGSTGISGVDGSSTAPAFQGNDTNTGIFYPAADTIAFAEGGVESMRLDSNGNVGIGNTPKAWATDIGLKALQISSTGCFYNYAFSGNNFTSITDNSFLDASGSPTYITTNSASQYVQSAGTHRWSTASSGTAGNNITMTERMRIDSSGNLFLGKTSDSDAAQGLSFYPSGAASFNDNNSGTRTAIGFRRSGTSVGTITTTTSATAYNTSSDYRLKENIVPMVGALDTVAQLKPCTYTWKADGSDGQGFIAHELQEIVPDCVTGEKDAVNEDGSIKPQGIDTSFLVATLTAAIQEQQTIINDLKARVTALEASNV